MVQTRLDEKRSARGTAGRVAIIICQHILLWASLYIAASTMYTLITGAITVKDIPSVVLLLVSSAVSLFYVALHNATTKVHTSATKMTQCERVDTLRSLAIFTLRVLTTLWLIAAAINITLTTSRQLLCALDTTGREILPLDRGTICILNRTGILSSFIALLASGILFLLLSRIQGPFRCHLLGIIPESRILPFVLPYHKTAKLAMRSEMSFKCRSSTSVESGALAPLRRASLASLVPAPRRKGSANLLPPNPRNALGVGIYTSRTQMPPAILTPSRPSLQICYPRARIYDAPPPPSPPLLPLPAAYLPYTYQPPPTTPRDVGNALPRRPARPMRTRSFMAEPITKPALALMELHLAALNRNDSLSSMYSRSTSGDTLAALSESGGSLTPISSTSSLEVGTTSKDVVLSSNEKKFSESQIGSRSEFPRDVISQRLSSWEVDGFKELEAKICSKMHGPVRHSARAGVMHRHVRDTWVESPNLAIRSKSYRPRKKIRKTRGSTGGEHGMF